MLQLANKMLRRLPWQRLSVSGTYIPVLALPTIRGSRRPSTDNRCQARLSDIIILALTLFSIIFPIESFAAKLIIEPEMGRAPIVNEISSAKQSVKLVMYNLTDKTLLNALLQQQRDGREVQIILEKTPYRTTTINKKTISKLKRANIEWQGKIPGKHFIHQKTLLIDNHEAVVMTFNFTHSTFKKQRNFALIFDDANEVRDIEQHFTADWQGITTPTHSSNLIWSPDDSRKKIISLINGAKQQLHIYAQSITDKNIITALEDAARRGVNVTVITSSKPSLAGIKVINHPPYYIHAKVFIIDNQAAVIGSINLTRNSLDQNRELAVITHDSAIINQLQQTFSSDARNDSAL